MTDDDILRKRLVDRRVAADLIGERRRPESDPGEIFSAAEAVEFVRQIRDAHEDREARQASTLPNYRSRALNRNLRRFAAITGQDYEAAREAARDEYETRNVEMFSEWFYPA